VISFYVSFFILIYKIELGSGATLLIQVVNSLASKVAGGKRPGGKIDFHAGQLNSFLDRMLQIERDEWRKWRKPSKRDGRCK